MDKGYVIFQTTMLTLLVFFIIVGIIAFQPVPAGPSLPCYGVTYEIVPVP